MNNLLDLNISLKINISKKNNNIEEMLMKLFLLSELDLEEKEKSGLEYIKNYHKWDKIIAETNMFYKQICET